MNIDEFLNSNDTIAKIGETTILKIKYNNTIDFIYSPEYGDFEYGDKLQFLGLFHKTTKKLYGYQSFFHFDYNKELYSNYYEGEISTIWQKLIDSANLYLNNYIKENKLLLISASKKVYDLYINSNNEYEAIKKGVIHDYIYQDDANAITLKINTNYYEKDIKQLVIEYIQNPLETARKIFDEYIQDNEKKEALYYNGKFHNITSKELIGIKLLKKQLRDKLMQEIQKNPNNEYKKKYDIIKSIKDLNAQMLNITLKHEKNTFEFKYPRTILKSLDFFSSKIPDLKIREKLEKIYKKFTLKEQDENFIKDIVKIEFNRKIIYEDKDFLKNKENNIEMPDIVDDMFD